MYVHVLLNLRADFPMTTVIIRHYFFKKKVVIFSCGLHAKINVTCVGLWTDSCKL
jgi:hypothetical protein